MNAFYIYYSNKNIHFYMLSVFEKSAQRIIFEAKRKKVTYHLGLNDVCLHEIEDVSVCRVIRLKSII